MSRPIRILVVDDHALVRSGIRALLATEPDMEVVGEAADGVEAIRAASELKPDVILMDLMMPEVNGIEAVKRIMASLPDVRILVLTSFASDDMVFPAIRAGAVGYLLKDSDSEDLVRAVRQVFAGESSLHPAIARRVLQEIADRGKGRRTVEPLTAREVEVLRQVADGRSNREIAAALFLTEATVRSYVSRILAKLHVASRTQAALYALRLGLISPSDN